MQVRIHWYVVARRDMGVSGGDTEDAMTVRQGWSGHSELFFRDRPARQCL